MKESKRWLSGGSQPGNELDSQNAHKRRKRDSTELLSGLLSTHILWHVSSLPTNTQNSNEVQVKDKVRSRDSTENSREATSMETLLQAAAGTWDEVSGRHIRTRQEQSTTVSSQCLSWVEERAEATHSHLLLLKSGLVTSWSCEPHGGLGRGADAIRDSPTYPRMNINSVSHYAPNTAKHRQRVLSLC